MKAVIESIGGVGSRAVVDGHELVFDQPATVPGGEERGPSPLDVMFVSVAACAHYFAAAYLRARQLSPEGLKVAVTAEKERLPVSRIGRVELRVQLPAGLPDRYVGGVERAIKSGRVTYDLARQMPGATEVSTTAFGDAIIAAMS